MYLQVFHPPYHTIRTHTKLSTLFSNVIERCCSLRRKWSFNRLGRIWQPCMTARIYPSASYATVAQLVARDLVVCTPLMKRRPGLGVAQDMTRPPQHWQAMPLLLFHPTYALPAVRGPVAAVSFVPCLILRWCCWRSSIRFEHNMT